MIGKPIIKGTCITVQHVLGLLTTQGATYHYVLHDYPHITQEDNAWLLFAQQAVDSSVFTAVTVGGHV